MTDTSSIYATFVAMTPEKIFLYGAYGYTAKLLLDILKAKGIASLLGGRNADKLQATATQYGLNFVVGSADEVDAVLAAHPDIELVVNCAGPFMETLDGVLGACMKHRKHYIDITGEIEVFEKARSRDAEAQASGIMVMPGTGFDVVPSDCLALFLKKRLPEAMALEMAFYGTGGVSRGTALTMVRGLGKGGAIRENGKIIPVPMGYHSKEIDFFGRKKHCTTIPWGDVSTSYFTTGIPNIVIYTVLPKNSKFFAGMFGGMEKIPVINLIPKGIMGLMRAFMSGPNEEVRTKAKSYLVGSVRDADGNEVKARLKTKEGYTLTAITCGNITERILKGDLKKGFQTPAACYGEGLILEVEGTVLEEY